MLYYKINTGKSTYSPSNTTFNTELLNVIDELSMATHNKTITRAVIITAFIFAITFALYMIWKHYVSFRNTQKAINEEITNDFGLDVDIIDDIFNMDVIDDIDYIEDGALSSSSDKQIPTRRDDDKIEQKWKLQNKINQLKHHHNNEVVDNVTDDFDLKEMELKLLKAKLHAVENGPVI